MTSPRGDLASRLAAWRALPDDERQRALDKLQCAMVIKPGCGPCDAVMLLRAASEQPCLTCNDTGWERSGGMQSTPCPSCHKVGDR